MISDLAQKKCVPCEGEIRTLAADTIQSLARQINEEWRVVNGEKITRVFTFKDFNQAMKFANSIATIAEEENHHPDLSISWGRVVVSVMTHAIDGLSENDFILASKIDKAYNEHA